MKKVISLLLSVVMVLSLVSVTAFAATPVVYLTSTADGTTLNAGDTFTVNCVYDDPASFLSLKAGLYFDTSLFEVTKISAGTVTYYDAENDEDATWTPTAKSSKTTANNTGIITYTYAAVGTEAVEMSGGKFFTVTFAAKEVATDTTYTFKVAEDNDYTGYTVTQANAPDSDISVTIKAAAPAETITVSDPTTSGAKMTWAVTATPSLINALTAKLYNTNTSASTDAVSLSWGETWSGDGDCTFNVITNLLDANNAQYTELEVASGSVSGRN